MAFNRNTFQRTNTTEYKTEPCKTSPTKAHHWMVPDVLSQTKESVCKYCKRERVFKSDRLETNSYWINSSGVQPKTMSKLEKDGLLRDRRDNPFGRF